MRQNTRNHEAVVEREELTVKTVEESIKIGGSTRKGKMRHVARALACCFIVAALTMSPIIAAAQERQSAEAAIASTASEAEDALDKLAVQAEATQELVQDIENKVEDSTAVDEAKTATSAAYELIDNANIESDSTGKTTSDIKNLAAANSETTEAAQEALVNLVDKTDAAETEYVGELQSKIAQALEEGKSAYTSSEGYASDAARSALEEALDAAEAEIASEAYESHSALEELLSALTDATEVAVAEEEEARAAEEAARAEAEAAEAAAAEAAAAEAAAAQSSSSSKSSSSSTASSSSASSSSSSSSTASSTWNVSYVAFTQDRLDAGYVCEWQSGYFVAHNWSSGGIMIASKPTYVVVNGTTYKYVSSINVSPNTTWQQVEGYVHANGGIGFQTCSTYDNTYIVTHYEPA